MVCFLVSLLSFVSLSCAIRRVHNGSFALNYVLRATTQNISIDCQSRYSVVINGSDPGPTIRLREGTTHWIRVFNDMVDQNLTIHWHGLSQRTAPFSDGTPQVAQWPIAPGHFFDYEVRPEIGDAGTYFYHSHVGYQSISAHGILIVEDYEQPPYDYAGDFSLLMGDFYNKTDEDIVSGLTADPFEGPGPVHAIVMNGQTGHAGLGDAKDASCAPHVLAVFPDKVYRLRFIGAGAKTIVTLGIEEHSTLTVIEADGTYSKPFTTDHVNIAPGQRFSVLLHTMSEADLRKANKTSFWIRYENRERRQDWSGYALLQYQLPGAKTPQSLPPTSPVTLPITIYDWLEYALEPLDSSKDDFPRRSTRTLNIRVTQKGIWEGSKFISGAKWALNNNSWNEDLPQTPYLIDVYNKGQLAIPNYEAALLNGGWDPTNQLFPAKIGEIIDIIWENSNIPTPQYHTHPLHVHGRHVWDLGSGNGTYDPVANEKKLAGFTPIKRDTTLLYRYSSQGVANSTVGWRAWRLKVEDAGILLMHCHSLQHMIMGKFLNNERSFLQIVQLDKK